MPSRSIDIIILKKNADRHASTMPDDGESALYKRCGFKKPDGFRVHCTWLLPAEGATIFVRVYGKTEGRAGSENKSELPPPVDSTLFFGNIAIVAYMGADAETARPTPLSVQRLESLFEMLIGGVEDLGGATADKADALKDQEAEEDDEQALLPRTREGYAKDGFVVEDDEDDNRTDEDSDDEAESTDADEDESDGEDEESWGSGSERGIAGSVPVSAVELVADDLGLCSNEKTELTAEEYDSE